MVKWIAMFLLIWFLYQIREIFPPFVVGGIVAYLLLPLVKYVSQQAKVPMAAAVMAIYVFLVGVLIAVGYFFPSRDHDTGPYDQREEQLEHGDIEG